MIRQAKTPEEVVTSMTMEELYVALGRYCGPNNVFICEKKYGVSLPARLVEEEIAERLMLDP